jgi:hypothetical protein
MPLVMLLYLQGNETTLESIALHVRAVKNDVKSKVRCEERGVVLKVHAVNNDGPGVQSREGNECSTVDVW